MDKNYSYLIIGLGIALVLIVLAMGSVCVLIYLFKISPTQKPTPTGPEALFTQAAQTVVVQLTQTAAAFPATVTATQPSATPLPSTIPTATPLPTFTSLPPSPTPVPPTLAPTPIPCLWAKFVEDVTVKDGTVFPPNASFTKTWRLKNIGSCAWAPDYLLVFVSGERMDGPEASLLNENVDPGETVDVSVDLIAPDKPGRYRGYWELSTPNGKGFGIGPGADDPFWVEINVSHGDDFPYDFAMNYCSAKWSSEEGKLDCPGKKGDADGFVLLIDKPVIEIGRKENEPALWTNPNDSDDGWIRGEYPELKVEDGQTFEAVVGCLDGASKCDVIFQLNYRIGDGLEQTLWQTHEVYDDLFTKVKVDLSSLKDQKVKFILTVLANGSATDDEAFWLSPRIRD